MEWRLQGDYPSTKEFHEHRDTADHLSQEQHTKRLEATADWIRSVSPYSVGDFGCGDGGLLSLIKDIDSWGYDFTPAHQSAWRERQIVAELRDVFNTWFVPRWPELVVATEVLEHIADPHGSLAWMAHNSVYLVCSSPWGERPDQDFDECHIWAWDFEGYRELLSEHYTIIRHEKVEWSQLILAMSKY